MDMKKILQALDGTKNVTAKADAEMKRFVSIVQEGKVPLNRLTAAESIAVNHYTAPKKDITSPVLNVPKGATPSMTGKYFKAVEQEFAESAERKAQMVRQLAERVTAKLTATEAVDVPKSEDETDTVTLDVPLFIRLLEYAKEDAADDMALHKVAENAIALGKSGTLSMDQYDEIVGANSVDESLRTDNPCWKDYKPVGTKKKNGKTVPNCVPKK